MSATATENPPCIFCNVANKLGNVELLYEDEDVCAFNDYKPVSRFHILVIPKRHIADVTILTATDKELVTKMHRVGQELLLKDKSLSLNNARLGYHWPPFLSVKHLHLHVIAPASELSLLCRMFKTNSIWFISPEYIASRFCYDSSFNSLSKYLWRQMFIGIGTKLLSILTSLFLMWTFFPFGFDFVKRDGSLTGGRES